MMSNLNNLYHQLLNPRKARTRTRSTIILNPSTIILNPSTTRKTNRTLSRCRPEKARTRRAGNNTEILLCISRKMCAISFFELDPIKDRVLLVHPQV
jgi:hypothetical protein